MRRKRRGATGAPTPRRAAQRSGALGALVAGVLLLTGCGTAGTPGATRLQPQSQPSLPTASPQCPRQQAVVDRALARSTLRVDVTGDGRPDTVAAATDPSAAEPCRAFVAVRVAGGGVLARHLIPAAIPVRGIRARIAGLPHLGDRPGAQVVVDTGAAADAVLAQLFTVVGGRLRAVRVPDQPDGSFIVVGGGVMFPRGAGCTVGGRLVLVRAAQLHDGRRFRVVRRTFVLAPDGVRFNRRTVTRATVPVRVLGARFPELAGPHWRACTPAPS